MASLKASCAAPAISRASAPLRAVLPSRRCAASVRAQASKAADALAEVSKIAVLGATAASFVQPEHAQAAQEAAQLAASDNRLGAIATLFVPALGWVAFNMLQPALNQLNRMTEIKEESNPSAKPTGTKATGKRRGVASAVGLGAAASMLLAENADAATEVAQLAASDNRLGAIATLFVPALGWVAFNMLQPALNQLNRQNEIREEANPSASSGTKATGKRRSVASAVGMGAAASMMLAQNAEAATEVAQLAASDNRLGAIATLFVPALGWVAFNMLQPALNQLNRQNEIREEANPSASSGTKATGKRRGVASAVGLGAAASMLLAENADAATEVAQLAASDNRLGAIATLFVPALGWVAFNMLQPALNQLNRQNEIREEANPSASSGTKATGKRRSVASAVGLGAAASMLLAENAEAVTEVAQLAASDNRLGAIATLFVPAIGWVGFNMLQPATNQLNRMTEMREEASPSAAPVKATRRK